MQADMTRTRMDRNISFITEALARGSPRQQPHMQVAGMAPGAKQCINDQVLRYTEQSEKRQARPQNIREAIETNSGTEADRHMQCARESTVTTRQCKEEKGNLLGTHAT